MDLDQSIKLYILSRKYSLTIRMYTHFGAQFHPDHLIFALQNDALDVALFYMSRYQTEIQSYKSQIVKAHVQSYSKSNQYLKYKLQLSQ